MEEIGNSFSEIAVLENAFEAQVLESVLQEEGIPHHIRSFHDTAYDGIFQFQRGWGIVLAPAVHQEQIFEILSNIRKDSSGMDTPE